jgi:hypothetical protein
MNLELRPARPLPSATKLCDSADSATDCRAKSHRPYGHQPTFAHLDVRSERRADGEEVIDG